MKYLFAFFIISILAACSGEENSNISDEQSFKKDSDLLESDNSTVLKSNLEEKLEDKNSLTIDENVSVVKQCQNNRCESYHLTINQKPVVAVNYASKKVKETRFVLTPDNIQSFNSALSELKNLDTTQLILCLNSQEKTASYSLTLGDAPNSTSYLFAVGCQDDPAELTRLARWFDSKAYAAVEN